MRQRVLKTTLTTWYFVGWPVEKLITLLGRDIQGVPKKYLSETGSEIVIKNFDRSFGLFELFGPFLTILDRLDQSGLFRIFGPFWTVLDHFGPFGPFWTARTDGRTDEWMYNIDRYSTC